MAVTEEAVWEVLKNCYDPEIPINLVDLGLIYKVQVTDGSVAVEMTLTAPGCPMHSMISQDVKNQLEQLEGVEEAQVQIVWDPPWTPERMSQAAKEQLGFA